MSMVNDRILVVDDEEDLAELVCYNLTKEGYQVTCVGSGELALGEARSQVPDLIVLDLLLPKVDGLDVCKQLKSDPKTQHIPIVMLTAKSEEVDMVTGLECGADDYITKPFSPRVLLARIRSVLRRRSKAATDDDPDALRISKLLIHPGRHEVLVNGTAIDLTFTEFRLLHFLAQAWLGFLAEPNRRCRQRRGLPGHRAFGRRASGRSAQEAWFVGHLYRNGPRSRLPL